MAWVVLTLMIWTSGAKAQLITHTYPTGEGEAVLSNHYKVFVKHGDGEEQELQVLQSNAIYSGDYRSDYLKGRTFSFAQVGYDQSAGEGLTFRVVKSFGTAALSALVSPRSYSLEHSLSGDGKEVSFSVDTSNRYISVNFLTSDNKVYVTEDQSWIKHMLCVFIDPPEADPPAPTDPGVVVYGNDKSEAELKAAGLIYFPAGYHNLEDYAFPGDYITDRGKLNLGKDQDVYIQGGAFLEGNIYMGGDYSKVTGRGILSMRQYHWKSSALYDGYDAGYPIHVENNCTVEGIMIMEAPWHGIVGKSKALIENIKYLGWHCNNDGIRVGSGSEIRNSFMRAVDDDFYNFNIWVHDMVLWKGHNGSIMTFGWGGNNTYFSGASLMEDIDVINPEWTGLGNNNGLIMSQTAYDYVPWDYNTGSTMTVLRNIRIEGKIPGLTNIKTKQGSEVLPQVPMADVGYLGDVLMENITVDQQFDRGVIAGKTNVASDGSADYFTRNITMEEIIIGGVCVTEENKGQFFAIDEATKKDLFFNGCNETGISIEFIKPVDGDKYVVGDSITVEAEISDADGNIVAAALYINEALVEELSEAPWIWMGQDALVDVQVGEYHYRIRATDEADNSWEESIALEVTPLPNVEDPGVFVKSDSSLLVYWTDNIDREEGFIVERSPAGAADYIRLDTVPANDTSYLDYPVEDFVHYHYRVRTLYPEAATQPSDPVLGRALISEHAPLPGPWKNHVFGDTLVAMSSTGYEEAGTFTIDAGDGDFWTGQDRGHFIGQPVSGDCEVIARVEDYQHAQSYTMAGVMIRDSLSGGSPFAAQFIISNPGAIMRVRKEEAGPVNQEINNTGEAAPYWVRLNRKDNTFQGSVSADGISWRIVRTETINMDGQVYIGMAATTHTTDTTGLYSFENVSVGAPLPEYRIAASATAGGSITPPGSHLVLEGATMVFSMAAGEGYELEDVLLDEVSQGAVPELRLEGISADHQVKAVFSRIVSVEDNESGRLEVYPVPVTGTMHIRTGGFASEGGSVEIYNLRGEKVLSGRIPGDPFQLDARELEAGFYLMKVSDGQTNRYRKILIQ